MPYFIQKAKQGWNTIKEDGTVIGSHPDKQGAIDQMVAISTKEKMKPGGEMRDAGTNIGISDIDDTLIVEGKIHQDFYAWLDHQPVDLYLVTGRPTTDRESTIAQLNNLGIQYQQLIMNPGGDSNQFKGDTAASLIEDGYTIAFAVDNNPEARQAYTDAGVGNVYDPAKMPAMASMAQRDGYEADVAEPVAYEAVEETTADLAGELSELLGNLVALKFQAHGYHWNVKGPLFAQFHELFGDIYADVDDTIDPTAENIRKLNVDAPFLLPDFVASTELDIKPVGSDPVALSGELFKSFSMVIPDLVEATETADCLNQYGIVNFLNDVQDRFQKWSWQLRVIIGDEVANLYEQDLEEVGEIHDPVQPSDQMEPAAGDYEGVDPSGAVNVPVTVEGRFVDPKFVQENRESGLKLLEQRTVTENIEFRQEGDGMTFSGYAATFNAPSQPLPFTEVIKPGAFKRSLGARNDIKLLWNHDTGQVLGSTRAGTLVLSEDERGLKVTAKLPNTSAGRDAAELIKRGDVNAMSFGFSVPAGGDSWSEDGNTRELNSVRLFEASIVAFPAYMSTAGTTSMRSGEQAEEKAADLSLLRKRLDLQK